MAIIAAGTAFFKLNGQAIDSAGEFQITMGGVQKEINVLAGGKQIAKVTDTPGKITGTIQILPTTDVNAIKNADNAVVIVQTRAGKTYTLRAATQTGAGEVDAMTNAMTIEFTGMPVRVV